LFVSLQTLTRILPRGGDRASFLVQKNNKNLLLPSTMELAIINIEITVIPIIIVMTRRRSQKNSTGAKTDEISHHRLPYPRENCGHETTVHNEVRVRHRDGHEDLKVTSSQSPVSPELDKRQKQTHERQGIPMYSCSKQVISGGGSKVHSPCQGHSWAARLQRTDVSGAEPDDLKRDH
jgi:hypothetical protein